MYVCMNVRVHMGEYIFSIYFYTYLYMHIYLRTHMYAPICMHLYIIRTHCVCTRTNGWMHVYYGCILLDRCTYMRLNGHLRILKVHFRYLYVVFVYVCDSKMYAYMHTSMYMCI